MSIRYAAAAARQQLLALAAQQLNVQVSQLRLTDGAVSSADGKVKINFTQLLNGQQLKGEVKLPLELKNKSDYTHVGKSVLRDDMSEWCEPKRCTCRICGFRGWCTPACCGLLRTEEN
jgi:hypothetical protein